MPNAAAKELTIRDPDAALLLLDSRRNRFLHPFIGQACSVSAAARELQVSRSLMSYWVGRLAGHGLLLPQGEGTRQRAWRAAADRLVVSMDDLPVNRDREYLSAWMDPFLEQLKDALVRVARRNAPEWEYRVERTPHGVFQHIAPRSAMPADAKLANNRGVVHLGATEAAQMRREMDAIYSRYRALSRKGPGRQRVLFWTVAVEDV